jgi:post-segregation antitoxin (ccd killing protein)
MGTVSQEPLSKAEQERRWLEKNREAIEAYNRRVAEQGLLSDETGLHGDPPRPCR